MTVTAVVIPMNEAKPLESYSISTDMDEPLEQFLPNLQEPDTIVEDVRQDLLLRTTSDGEPGLVAYNVAPPQYQEIQCKNTRATRLAMACGKFSTKLFGNVLLVRTSLSSRTNLTVNEVFGACNISVDLRYSMQKEMYKAAGADKEPPPVPEWLGNALQQNYHDQVVLNRLADVMRMRELNEGDDGDDNEDDSDQGDGNSTSEVRLTSGSKAAPSSASTPRQFITKQPLCLYCRRPADKLCGICNGAYFCKPPKTCREAGWTHDCLCRTWKRYIDRRSELSMFLLGEWTQQLITPEFQNSEEPYEQYLHRIGIVSDDLACKNSWWTTELYGWAGGGSQSAKSVDIYARRPYKEGFFPLKDIPLQQHVHDRDVIKVNEEHSFNIQRNSLGFLYLSSWEEYYHLRGISLSSPVALLCTFPLTLYYAITKYGEVACTVARMLKRPLRVHIVGVEKEANFLDLFQEVGFLSPKDFQIELVFVVREDMVPDQCRQPSQREGGGSTLLKVELTINLTIVVVSGTYGDSLDPQFDCGCGAPDIVVGLNGGLYAYNTWRSVVSFLYNNAGVLGVFTDYNEYSGVNCASLAGHAGRQSLCINPFRQPRSMPVWSMNLPQVSNGFLYVFNQQELQ